MKRTLDQFKADGRDVQEVIVVDEEIKTFKEHFDRKLGREVIILDSEPSNEKQQKKVHVGYSQQISLLPMFCEFRNFIHPDPHESIEAFTERMKPSKTPQTIGNWLYVSSLTDHPSSAGSLDLAIEECEGILATWSETLRSIENDPNIPTRTSKKTPINKKRAREQQSQEVIIKLTASAKRHGVTVGKWLIFSPPTQVDAMWKAVALATHKGLLGCSAKVATANVGTAQDALHVMCVYTNDFSDREDVARVLRELQKMFPNITRWNYKCDLYT